MASPGPVIALPTPSGGPVTSGDGDACTPPPRADDELSRSTRPKRPNPAPAPQSPSFSPRNALTLSIAIRCCAAVSRSRTVTVWSLGVESTDDLALAADVYGDDRGKPWVSAGGGYTLGGGVRASLSYALQLDRPRVRVVTRGAKLAF